MCALINSLYLSFLQNGIFISISPILQNKPVSFVRPGRATFLSYLSTVALTACPHHSVIAETLVSGHTERQPRAVAPSQWPLRSQGQHGVW